MSGLSSILDMRKRVNDLNNALESGELMRIIISENEVSDFITETNAEKQLYEQGVNRLGVSIMDYRPYSEVTIQIKRAKGQPVNRVTLRDTGDFHKRFYVIANNDSFRVWSSDGKTRELYAKYGEIFGLTEENLRNLVERYIYPRIIKETNKYLKTK